MPRFVIQFLVPSITHSSPSGTARVIIPPGSEPASGSDSANAGLHSPVAHRGRKRSFSSSEPNSLIGSVPSSWIIRISAVEAHALAISSTAMFSISVPVPVPPCSVSNGQAEDVLLGEQLAQVVRVLGLLVDLGRARRDPLACDLADRVAEIEVLLRDRVQLGERGHLSRIVRDRYGRRPGRSVRPQRGGIRSAPSSRITSPLSISFSTMCTASAANSSGRPSRAGTGPRCRAPRARPRAGPPSSGVSNVPGAIVHTRMPDRGQIARGRQRHPDDRRPSRPSTRPGRSARRRRRSRRC